MEFWTTMKVDGEAVTIAGCLLLDFTDTWQCWRLREYWHYLPGQHHQPPASGDDSRAEAAPVTVP